MERRSAEWIRVHARARLGGALGDAGREVVRRVVERLGEPLGGRPVPHEVRNRVAHAPDEALVVLQTGCASCAAKSSPACVVLTK